MMHFEWVSHDLMIYLQFCEEIHDVRPWFSTASGADDEEFFSAEEDGDHWTEHVEHTEHSLWKAQPLLNVAIYRCVE